MVLFSRGDLLLLVSLVRVDGVLEANEREKNESLPLAPLESSEQVRNYSRSVALHRVILDVRIDYPFLD